MKRGVFLAESPLDSHRPLGAFGQPVHLSYVQLRAAVAQRLGERHANLFARPQIDDRSGVIRWVAPMDGEPRRWADLDPQEQADRALDLQIMKAEFDTYLADLKMADGGKAFASVLENALQTPNDGHLHFVGDQPVMTFWGFTELGGESFAPLTAAPPPAAAIASAAAGGAEPKRGFPVWLWWLLPLLLLALLLLWWLFWYQDVPKEQPFSEDPVEEVQPQTLDESRPIERPDSVLVEDGDVVGREDVRILEQDGTIVEEESTLESPPSEEGVIPPEPESEPVSPEEPPLPEDNLPEDAAPDDVASDDAAPEEPPAPDAEPDETGGDGDTPPAEELEIPDPTAPGATVPEGTDGATGTAAPFMQGEWRSRSGLTDENGAPLDQRYEFDDKGQGQSVIRRSDGVRCTAPAEARMQDGKLVVVEKSNPTCPDGREFLRSETVCERGADGKTRCKGDGFDVRIERSQP